MNSIKLNFINRSDVTRNSRIVIFQKNEGTSFDDLAIAWKVIKNCSQGDSHPFIYEHDTQIVIGDSYGNMTAPQTLEPGYKYEIISEEPTGNFLQRSTRAATSSSVEIYNVSGSHSAIVYIYRNRRLIATKGVVASGQKTIFDFKPCIYIGLPSGIEEGDIIDSAVISEINKQVFLAGIASADLVMSEGGTGIDATPFEFSLENVIYS